VADWSVGADRGLSVDENASWDGAEAAGRVFAWAGWPDDPNPSKARRAFLTYDRDADEQKGAYKLPFADEVDGRLVAVKAGINNAASRLSQTSIPQEVKDRARAVIEHYQAKWQESKAVVPPWLRRRPDAGELEFRAATVEATDAGFTGHAATFMTADFYLSCFAPGCFSKTLGDRGDRLPVLWQHDPDVPIGKHLAIAEDATGLAVDVEIIDDGAEGSSALKRLRGGLPLGLSFGFNTVKDRSAEEDDQIDLSQLPGVEPSEIRVITEVKLWETSVVTFPANEQATIDAVRQLRRASVQFAGAAAGRDADLVVSAADAAALSSWSWVGESGPLLTIKTDFPSSFRAHVVAASESAAAAELSHEAAHGTEAEARRREIDRIVTLTRSREYLGVRP
jgi:HK97 family phage prohead protease